MNLKSILLGGALTVALAGAGFAQQAKPDEAQQMQTRQTTPKSMHHVRHHMLHRMHHRIHTASLRAVSSPAERHATRDLNLQQVRMTQYGAPGSQYARGAAYGPQYGPYQREPGQNGGLTPTNRIPNGTPYQTATPSGGRQDTQSINEAHAR
jgi:hypothetical protein